MKGRMRDKEGEGQREREMAMNESVRQLPRLTGVFVSVRPTVCSI